MERNVPDDVVIGEGWLKGWDKRMRRGAGEIQGCRWHLLFTEQTVK